MATELASAYLTLIPSLKSAQKQIESQLSGVNLSKSGKSMGSSLVSGFGGAFGKIAKAGVGAVAGIATAVTGLALGGGISRAMKLDEAQFKFKALGMDVESAMASCNEAVSGTAFGLDAAATVATQLGAAGVASGDAMTGALKSVAGVAAMSGRSMEDIGSIFGKVAAKGKVTGDELLQLNEAGINATAALAKHLGKTSDEVSQMVSKGEIDFATFSAAMQDTFGEAASGANEMFQGAASNIMAALSRIGAKFASPALDGLRKVFVALIPAIDQVSKAMDPLVDVFTSVLDKGVQRAVDAIGAFTGALSETGSFVDAFKAGLASLFEGTKAGSLFDSLAQKVTGFATAVGMGTSPVALMKNYLIEFGRYLAGKLAPAIDFAKEKIATLPMPIQSAIEAIESALANGGGAVASFVGLFAVIMAKFHAPIELAVGAVGKLGGSFAGIGSKVSMLGSAFMTAGGGIKGLTTVLGAFVSPVGLVVAAVAALAAGFAYLMVTNEGFRSTIMGLVEQIGASLAPALLVVGETLSNLAAAVLPLLSNMIMMLVPVIGQIITAIMQIVAALAPVITTLVTVLVPVIAQIIELVVTVAAQILAAVLPVITTILSTIQAAMPTIQSIIETAMAVVLSVVETVWPAIQSIIDTVMVAIQDIINIVTAAIRGDWDGVWNGVKKLFEDVWNGIVSTAETVLGILQNAIGTALDVIQGVWNSAWDAVSSALDDCWDGIKTGVLDGIDAVMGFLEDVPGMIQGLFSGAGSWLVDAGANILYGLWDGISGALDWLGGQLAGIGDFIAAHKGPKQYDLKLLVPNGGWIMESLSSGIKAGMPGLKKTLEHVSDSVSAVSLDPFDGVDAACYASVTSSIEDKASSTSAERKLEELIYTVERLHASLGDIIEERTPTMGRRDFRRVVSGL